jgi:hypothetical protein
MNHCIEISCYVLLEVDILNLYETLSAFESVIMMWALLIILQSGDKYMETHACFRHLEAMNCELKRYILLNISMRHIPACDTGHCSRSEINYPPLMEPESLLLS